MLDGIVLQAALQAVLQAVLLVYNVLDLPDVFAHMLEILLYTVPVLHASVLVFHAVLVVSVVHAMLDLDDVFAQMLEILLHTVLVLHDTVLVLRAIFVVHTVIVLHAILGFHEACSASSLEMQGHICRNSKAQPVHRYLHIFRPRMFVEPDFLDIGRMSL